MKPNCTCNPRKCTTLSLCAGFASKPYNRLDVTSRVLCLCQVVGTHWLHSDCRILSEIYFFEYSNNPSASLTLQCIYVQTNIKGGTMLTSVNFSCGAGATVMVRICSLVSTSTSAATAGNAVCGTTSMVTGLLVGCGSSSMSMTTWSLDGARSFISIASTTDWRERDVAADFLLDTLGSFTDDESDS